MYEGNLRFSVILKSIESLQNMESRINVGLAVSTAKHVSGWTVERTELGLTSSAETFNLNSK